MKPRFKCRKPFRASFFRAGTFLSALVIAAQASVADPSPDMTGETAAVVFLRPSRSIPAVGSSALTQKAWKALTENRFDEAILIGGEIATRFGGMADRQQQQLRSFAPPERAAQYGPLNDVATGLFIKGKSLRSLGRNQEAREVYQEIMQNYRFAQCWDPKGWFWKVAEAAQDEINSMDFGVDFGDYTSETLTTQAWKAYQARRFDAVELYTRKCVDLYADIALDMQGDLNGLARKGAENDYWALNDVATCLLIRGKSLQQQRRNKEAAILFNEIIQKYPSAQCWNPIGHFWRVAEAAQRSLVVHSP